ncbi:MAG: hypothetical protein J5I94_03400 [Phaeodactylibacter sp.]|nr:hypothetical protein [Phaeodactylibacter sp.]
MKNLALVLLCLLPFLLAGQPSSGALYLSKQTGKFSTLSGSGSKSTDQHESGTVTISHTGPITWTVTPSDISISPNESKSWSGTIQPDMTAAPEPGASAEATIRGDYDVNFSRPAGAGTVGAITGVYSCGDSCWYHPSGGSHELVNHTGFIERAITVYSIEVKLPDTICLAKSQTANSATGAATAESFPAGGGSFEWTVLNGPVTITNGNSQAASFELTDTTVTDARVKVKFTMEGVSYEAEAPVKACDCNCKEAPNGETFGPLTVQFAAVPDAPSPDGEGYCSYTVARAQMTLKMDNPLENKEAAVQDVRLSYKKHCETGKFKDVTLSWTGEQPLGAVKFIDVSMKAFSLSVSPEGNLSGSVTLSAALNQDKDLTGKNLMILKQGVNGDFKFNFAGGNSFAGSFDFLGVRDINIHIVKGGGAIAKFENGALSSGGTLSGTFTAVGGAEYRSNAFKVTMNGLSLGLELSMAGGFKLLDGNGSATISEMTGVDGSVKLSLAYHQGNCNATVELAGTSITAFSMTLTGLTLMVNFNSDFDMIEFDGSLKAKHEQFDAAVDVAEFNVKNGELTKFNASGTVKYKQFAFELISAAYAPVKLTVSAKVELNVTVAMKLMVDQFTIDEDGAITVGKIEGDLEKTPVKVSFKASFQAGRFTGSFKGDFTTIGLEGDVDVGAKETYNFGYFKLTAKVNVPLGNSGLKLTQLGGEMGFNYQLPNTPTQGMYLIGLTIGVADVADFCEVAGNPVIQLGNSTVIMTLNGTIAILKNNTFFSGRMNVNYKIPDNVIWGSVGTTVKIPGSGFILTTNNVSVSFNIGNNRWSASGSGMGGSMFDGVVRFSNGHVNMRGSLSNPLALSGRLGGKASAAFNYTVNESAGGNSFYGNIRINMNADILASINQNGLAGSFGAYVTGYGRIMFDTWIWSSSVSISGWSNARISVSGNSASLSGTMTINLPFSIPFWGNQVSAGLSLSI